jgi:hypothetical protein
MSPATRPAAPSGPPSTQPLSPEPWFRAGAGTRQTPAPASIAHLHSKIAGLSAGIARDLLLAISASLHLVDLLVLGADVVEDLQFHGSRADKPQIGLAASPASRSYEGRRRRHSAADPSPVFAICATGRVAGHPGVVSDPFRALLFRGSRSGCLLDSCSPRPPGVVEPGRRRDERISRERSSRPPRSGRAQLRRSSILTGSPPGCALPRFRSRGRSRPDDRIRVLRSRRGGHRVGNRALVGELRAVRRTRFLAARGSSDRGPFDAALIGQGGGTRSITSETSLGLDIPGARAPGAPAALATVLSLIPSARAIGLLSLVEAATRRVRRARRTRLRVAR